MNSCKDCKKQVEYSLTFGRCWNCYWYYTESLGNVMKGENDMSELKVCGNEGCDRKVSVDYGLCWPCYYGHEGEYAAKHKIGPKYDLYHVDSALYLNQGWEVDLSSDVSKEYVEDGTSTLMEAERIVNGDRASDYGSAKVSFTKIAKLANMLIGGTIDLTPKDVVKVLMAVKLVREQYKHKRDNLVDLCGYAELLNRIEE